MSQTAIIVLAVIVAIALLLVLLLRSRKQHVTFGEGAAPPPMAPARPAAPVAPPAPVVRAAAAPEGHDVGSEITAAIEDVVDQFVGIDAHPSGRQEPGGDRLTLLKGLGPKAEARLKELGVAHFDQIAGWTPADVEAIDAQMGAFKGRIVRDRWVEQARFLAKGDTAGFEAAFGSLGG